VTKQEVNKLLALMKANYSYAFKTMSQQDKYMLLNTWTFTLQDLPADVVMIAVMQIISTSKWLPTVAEIREQCKKLYYEATPYNNPIDWLDEEDRRKYGIPEPTQEEIEAEKCRKAKLNYIQNATSHLRGDRQPQLTLHSILSSPAFAGIGDGRSGLSLLGEARYEITDGREENGYE